MHWKLLDSFAFSNSTCSTARNLHHFRYQLAYLLKCVHGLKIAERSSASRVDFAVRETALKFDIFTKNFYTRKVLVYTSRRLHSAKYLWLSGNGDQKFARWYDLSSRKIVLLDSFISIFTLSNLIWTYFLVMGSIFTNYNLLFVKWQLLICVHVCLNIFSAGKAFSSCLAILQSLQLTVLFL